MILKKDYISFIIVQEKNNQASNHLLCVGEKKYRTRPSAIDEIPFVKALEYNYCFTAKDIIKDIILYINKTEVDELYFDLDKYEKEIQTILAIKKRKPLSIEEYDIKRKILVDVFISNKKKYKLLNYYGKIITKRKDNFIIRRINND